MKYAPFAEWLTEKAIAAGYEVDLPHLGARSRLAEAAGLHTGSLSQILTGSRLPACGHWALLAEAVKVEVDDLAEQVKAARRTAPRRPRRPRGPQLIGLAGLARSGKDSAASALVEAGWTRRAFADPLKEMLYVLDPLVFSPSGRRIRLSGLVDGLGWEGAKKLPEVRALLQRGGTEAGRGVLGHNVWVDQMFRDADAWTKPVVIPDVRFPNEAEEIRRRGGLVVLIGRPGQALIDGASHISEHALAYCPVDATILNTGTLADLGDRIRAIAKV
ncbi:hypothetical protein ACIOGZ_08280 [Kitasatospora sp. NPDC088160]|uniref:deoxynucleotide monophosphate kinase family protein n=1 Tax=Kitasatospora sp. NPDC088160 TaxID=3364072 RepID=UPI0037FD2BCE